ncbi:MAG: hypothetical protein N4A47_02085 [Clostridia bacterium]|jgi:hypothetical protein|nr:hypothetical protein [Clostridia bacterium]
MKILGNNFNYNKIMSNPKLLVNLKQGEVFKGDILDIKQGEVKIKTTTGEELVAKTNNNGNYKIGDRVEFLVKANVEGKMKIEYIKTLMSSSIGKIDNGKLMYMLKNGLEINPENKKLLSKFLGKDFSIIDKLMGIKLTDIKEYKDIPGKLKELIETAPKEVKEYYSFLKEVNEYNPMIIIPFRNEDREYEGKVFLIKENKEVAKTVLAIDLLNLGYSEIFIIKDGKDIYIDIKLEKEESSKIIENNIKEFEKALTKKGYKLKGIRYLTLDSKYDVFSAENVKGFDIRV